MEQQRMCGIYRKETLKVCHLLLIKLYFAKTFSHISNS